MKFYKYIDKKNVEEYPLDFIQTDTYICTNPDIQDFLAIGYKQIIENPKSKQHCASCNDFYYINRPTFIEKCWTQRI